ncbi:MAG TPA: NADP-dependent oxidoreductase, partial [Bryobacteraceae bacterium]|nr:NADP-dependent oxidoreductase [Bryobacteraceae bacterium]
MPTNRQLVLRNRPKGLLAPGDLELAESPLPTITDGQALARVKYLSIDPTMRVWMAMDSYMPAVAIGDVMRAAGLAEVAESRTKEFKKGDKVIGLTGLQDYCVIDPADQRGSFRKVPPIPFISDTAFLGVLGITGLTAYFGMMDIAKPQKGETLVVSAAAGATGSIAGQIGKIHGCRVVGIAGGPEKCNWLTNDLGFDAAVDYKATDWKEKLTAATPKGVDI